MSDTREETRRCWPCELRVVKTENRADGQEKAPEPDRIVGLAIPYNKPSEDLGGFREVWKPGAFRETLNGTEDVFADVEHDRARKLARRNQKTLTLQETREGLRVEIAVPDTTTGRDTLEEVRNGLLDGMSIAFTDAEEEYSGKGDQITRTVKQAKLRAVTLTSFPAFPQTAGTLAARSLTEYRKQQENEETSEADGETETLHRRLDLDEAAL